VENMNIEERLCAKKKKKKKSVCGLVVSYRRQSGSITLGMIDTDRHK
jgi:hypothetical protein